MTSKLPPNPFVGLRPFEAEESLLFFGRHQQTLELMQRLHESRFVAVVGSSGSGKSSLVRAGLIPKLQAGFLVEDRDVWHVARMQPRDQPFQNLVDALSSVTEDGPSKASEEMLDRARETGGQCIVDLLRPALGTKGNLLLLVDQFEEVFRFISTRSLPHHQSVIEEAADFVSVMLGMAQQRELPVYVIMTMRSDFLGDCDTFLGLPEAMNQSRYLVPRLTRQQRREAIEGPVRLYDGQVRSRLTDRLLNETVDVRDDLREIRTGDEVGRITHPADGVAALAFGPSLEPRLYLASGGEDGTVRIWPARLEDLVSPVCSRLPRKQLNERECIEYFPGEPCPDPCGVLAAAP